jgi:hypothetical protein
MSTPNIAAMLQQLSPASRAGSAATGSFSFLSGQSGTYSSGGGATRVRLVRTDGHGSQSRCRHQIGTASGPTSEKVCIAERTEGAETCGTRHQGEEVALEADALYIRVAKNQILGRPFLPCTILAEDYVTELLAETKELVDWQTLFADIIRAAEDSSHATIDAELLHQWQDSILRPLRTPGRIRTRLMASPSEDSEISGEERAAGIQDAPDTPDVNIGFTVEPETFEEWSRVGLPESLIDTLRALQQGLDKANIAILGLHRDFSAMGGVMADDIHALDCRVQSLVTLVGKPQPIPGVMAGNIWEALSCMGQTPFSARMDSSAQDVQERLGSIAASLAVMNQDAATQRTEKAALTSVVQGLEQQLASTLGIALDLRVRLDGLVRSSTAPTMAPRNVFDISEDFRQTPILEELIPPLQGGPRVGFRNSEIDAVSRSEFTDTIVNLRAEVGLLKKQGASRGSISCFQDLLPGVQSLEDVHSWVVANFGGASGGGGGDDPDSSIWGEMKDSGSDGPTFGPFCDIYVLLAAAEDLDSVLSKGDTLKEMDYIQKAGINHPAEAVVIYSLKRAVPGIFGDGMGSGGSSFLPKLKTAADWEAILSTDANAKPGLRDILTERHEAIEALIRGHIYDSLTSKGLHKAAELAKEMLSASVKLLKLLMDYMTSVYRKLVELSGFLPQDAWSLTTQVVRDIFVHMSNVRSDVRSISPRDSATKNTSKVLFTLLKTHAVMLDFVRHEIKNHPIVSSAYVKFLATHSPMGEVRKLREEIKTMNLLVKSAQAESKKAITIATDAVRKMK